MLRFAHKQQHYRLPGAGALSGSGSHRWTCRAGRTLPLSVQQAFIGRSLRIVAALVSSLERLTALPFCLLVRALGLLICARYLLVCGGQAWLPGCTCRYTCPFLCGKRTRFCGFPCSPCSPCTRGATPTLPGVTLWTQTRRQSPALTFTRDMTVCLFLLSFVVAFDCYSLMLCLLLIKASGLRAHCRSPRYSSPCSPRS